MRDTVSLQMIARFIRIVLLVALGNVVVIGSYWLLICGTQTASGAIPYAWRPVAFSSIYFWVFFLLSGLLVLGLYYVNSHLFSKIKNDYLWSLCSIVLSLPIVTYVVIAGVHVPCELIFLR